MIRQKDCTAPWQLHISHPGTFRQAGAAWFVSRWSLKGSGKHRSKQRADCGEGSRDNDTSAGMQLSVDRIEPEGYEAFTRSAWMIPCTAGACIKCFSYILCISWGCVAKYSFWSFNFEWHYFQNAVFWINWLEMGKIVSRKILLAYRRFFVETENAKCADY